MGWGMPGGIRQGERIPYKCTNFGTTRSRETFDPILDSAWKINGMRLGATWWNRTQRAGHILFEQEIYRLQIKVFILGKDVLCTGMDSSKAQTIHALPHYLAHCKIGSYYVYFLEAFTIKKDRKVASAIIRIWHLVRVSKGHQKKYDSRLSSRES